MRTLESCVDFLQRLIQTPSLPGQEAEVAHLVKSEMERLGYDRIYTDDAGNVIGCIEGAGDAPAIMLNTHLDHVDVGEHDAWPYPPFGGEIHDEAVWGRGAVDIKGPLAAQVYGAAELKRQNIKPPGDVYVTSVVYEEIGGVGARHLASHLCPDLIVIGEPSSNRLRRGHRGRLELVLQVTGRSVHASVPGKGVNPLQVISRFIALLEEISMAGDPDLGVSSVAPTLIRTDQTSSNVVPGEAWLTLDWRNVPGETEQDVLAKLQEIVERSLIPGAKATLTIPIKERICYTGFSMHIPACNVPFVTRENDPVLQSAVQILTKATGAAPAVDFWNFATDGGHFVHAGATCIGYAPGDDLLAHTVNEHIEISQIETAIGAYAAIAQHWAANVSRA